MTKDWPGCPNCAANRDAVRWYAVRWLRAWRENAASRAEKAKGAKG